MSRTHPKHWSVEDIPDQRGRVAIVTGANSGIGYHCSVELARHGARVVLACRDEGRGRDAVERLVQDVPDATVDLSLLDLSDLESVARFADEFLERNERLGLLVNNAGVMAVPQRRTTAQGFELQFGTNHLGHFALTARLLRAFVDVPGARVVTVSSLNHWVGRLRLDDLNAERRYDRWAAYNQSKLANVLFFRELDRRLRAARSPAISVGAHPGYTATNLQTSGPRMGHTPLFARILPTVTHLTAQSARAGAWPLLYAATVPDVEGGEYVGPSRLLAEVRGTPGPAIVSPKGRDAELARALWERSEELTGVTFELAPAR